MRVGEKELKAVYTVKQQVKICEREEKFDIVSGQLQSFAAEFLFCKLPTFEHNNLKIHLHTTHCRSLSYTECLMTDS